MKREKDFCVVIIAGGTGTRFWPLSRETKPKQFLTMGTTGTLFQETVARVYPLVNPDNIYVVSGAAYRRVLKEQCRPYGIPAGNILLEPSGKNTAPAICWAASVIFKKNPRAVMAVFPADHLIRDPAAFRRHLQEASALARQQYLVTLGVVPTRPETGYGYMRCFPVRKQGRKIWRVEQFVEKPDVVKARLYIKEKNYFWNSGMFIWRVDNILTEFAARLPQAYELLFNRSAAQIRRDWKRLPAISVDYAILEKAEEVVAVPAGDMGWSDLGSWEALADAGPRDKDGNGFRGDVVQQGCRNTFVHAGTRLAAVVGLDNIVVVATDDAVLVCRKDSSQQVRDIVGQLKSRKGKKYL